MTNNYWYFIAPSLMFSRIWKASCSSSSWSLSWYPKDLRLRLPNQIPPPTPRYLLLEMSTPIPIPIAVPTMKAVIPTHTVGFTNGLLPWTGICIITIIGKQIPKSFNKRICQKTRLKNFSALKREPYALHS